MPRTTGTENHKTTRLIAAAVDILNDEYPMTIRQLFYRLVSRGLIPNDRKHYQLVSRVMTKARDDGRCSFDYIVDRSRPQYSPNVFKDAGRYADVVQHGYRKDYWATQPNHVEIWVEKDAIIGSIEPTTNALGVTIRVGRGFLSTTKAHDIAEHFQTIDKPITVFYLGDHDPSGQDIERDLYDRTDTLQFWKPQRGQHIPLPHIGRRRGLSPKLGSDRGRVLQHLQRRRQPFLDGGVCRISRTCPL